MCLNKSGVIFSDGFQLVWVKGDIDLGNLDLAIADKLNPRLTHDNRFQLVKGTNGNTLVISFAELEDAGDYRCQVQTSYRDLVIEIKHSVMIRKREIRGKSF